MTVSLLSVLARTPVHAVSVPTVIARECTVRFDLFFWRFGSLFVYIPTEIVMHPTDNSILDAFSPCSQTTICSQYPKLGTCLRCKCGIHLHPATALHLLTIYRALAPGYFSTISAGVCGNGVKEAGEQCDCGTQCATDNCCDGATCKFKNNAQCDQLNDECCQNCQLMSNGTVCRPSMGVCDYTEYCNGLNATCPPDQFVADGTVCNSAQGLACASGSCTSRDQQCISNNTYFTTVGVCPGHESDCALWCSTGSSGCLKGAGSFLDGTPCGYGGMCYQGSCTSSNFFYQILNWFQTNPSIAIPGESSSVLIWCAVGLIYYLYT